MKADLVFFLFRCSFNLIFLLFLSLIHPELSALFWLSSSCELIIAFSSWISSSLLLLSSSFFSFVDGCRLPSHFSFCAALIPFSLFETDFLFVFMAVHFSMQCICSLTYHFLWRWWNCAEHFWGHLVGLQLPKQDNWTHSTCHQCIVCLGSLWF